MAIADVSSLELKIRELEGRREAELQEIKGEFRLMKEKLKPGNLIRSAIGSFNSSPDLKRDVKNGLMGIGAGFLTNKLFLGSVKGPLKKVIGIVVEAAMANVALKYPETIKNTGISMLTKFLKSIRLPEKEIESQHMSGGAAL